MGDPETSTASATSAASPVTTAKSKLVVVGDCACGKTTMIKRYITEDFTAEYTPTGFDTYTTSYDVTDAFTIQVSLWDTSGDSSYDKVRPMSYSGADIIIVCFSVAEPESLQNVISKWYPEIRENCPKQPVIVVGCKSDLRDHGRRASVKEKLMRRNSSMVAHAQGIKVAKSIDAAMYTEISAKMSPKSVQDIIEVAAMSAAGYKAERHNSTVRRRRFSLRRKRFSEIVEIKQELKEDVSKSCVVM